MDLHFVPFKVVANLTHELLICGLAYLQQHLLMYQPLFTRTKMLETMALRLEKKETKEKETLPPVE